MRPGLRAAMERVDVLEGEIRALEERWGSELNLERFYPHISTSAPPHPHCLNCIWHGWIADGEPQ